MTKGRSLKPGYAYLLHDPGDPGYEWSLWSSHEDRDEYHVDWSGKVIDPPQRFPSGWTEKAKFVGYRIDLDRIEGICMAARHLATREAWFRFCKRQVSDV